MDDAEILELYFMRSEAAVQETRIKYGKLILDIAMRILNSAPDAEECENDTYLGAWSAIPPKRPSNFMAFLAKTARNLALKRYHFVNAAKRSPRAAISLSELEECISEGSGQEFYSDGELASAINDFLGSLKDESRRVFMLRYWYFASISEICDKCRISKSKAESMLFRTRKKLKKFLEERGLY